METNLRKIQKAIAIALALVLVALYFFVGIPSSFGERPIADALSYHFLHANILHLITNCYVLIILFSRRFSLKEMLAAYLIATMSFLLLNQHCIGFSNILYAVMGLRTPSLKSSWWRSPSTIVFLLVTICYLFFPNISAITHISSFIAGCFIAYAGRIIKQVNSDYEKAGRKR